MRITYRVEPGGGIRAVAFHQGEEIACTQVYASRYLAITKLGELLGDHLGIMQESEAVPAQRAV